MNALPLRPVLTTWRERLVLFFVASLLVCVPYLLLQWFPAFGATVMSETAFDRAVPFVPAAAALYLSLYLQLSLPVFLARERGDVMQIAFGFIWTTLVSHIVFLFWPTAIPEVARIPVEDPLLRMVLAIDGILNACPSLHASLGIYCALCCGRLLTDRRARLLLWVWTFLILAAALLTKRHVIIDLLGGAALGGFAYAALFRPRPIEAAESEALAATMRAREEVTRGLGRDLSGLTQQSLVLRARDVLFFGMLAVSGVWLTVSSMGADAQWPAVAAGVVITALALNTFVLLMHEGMHDTLFRHRGWNRAGSVLLGSTFLMSFSAYRVLHIRHHKYLGDARDPDDYHNYTHRPLLVWALHFVRLTVGPLLYLVLIPILALRYGNESDRRSILAEYAVLLVLYSLALRWVTPSILAVAWGLPLLIVGVLTAIRGFTQHGITDASDPYVASRTILPHPIVGFFLLHENYHLEHHLFPEVPSYHLPQLHRLAWPGLPRAVSGRGYLEFLVKFMRATARLDETPIGLEVRQGGRR